MRAQFTINNFTFPLCEIREEEMTEILKDHEKEKLTGYPMFFDAQGRIWPRAPKTVAVEFFDT